MAIVFDILEEERRRLVALSKQYSEKLSQLPKGSLSRKRRYNKDYYYLARREGSQVRFFYVGPASSDKVKSIGADIERRRELVAKLKKVQADLTEVDRSLRGKH